MAAREKCSIVAALAGAPNVGKTTLFNALTGATGLVANWPGATVAVEYSVISVDGEKLCIVDLPGTYSLNGSGPEETVARDFILENKPDVIVALADSTNLERSLHLPLEILELYDRVIVVLTKYDEAQRRGIKIDLEGLSRELGVPVIPVSAVRKEGVDRLVKLIVDVAKGRVKPRPRITVVVPEELRDIHKRVVEVLEQYGVKGRLAEWLAARLISGVEWAPRLLERIVGAEKARKALEEIEKLKQSHGVSGVDVLFISKRFELIESLYRRYVSVEAPAETTVSQGFTRLDLLFLNPRTGPLVSFLVLFTIFIVSYMVALGSPIDTILHRLGFESAARIVEEYNLVELTAKLMDAIAAAVEQHISHPVLARLIGEGILSSGYGVGLVVTFLPLVGVFMALVAILEDSGLIPRIAAGVDRFFRVFGVSGKAVFPALLSFGCNVPAVLSTRIIEGIEERKAVMYALPLLPCTARYTVIMAFAYTYFHGVYSAVAAFTVYMIAISAFLLTIKLYTKTKNVGAEEFLLELPPLKKPSLRVVWWLTWDKLKHFIVRAGTVILAASMVLWLLANYGPHGYLGENGDPAESYAAQLGHAIAPYAKLIAGVSSDLAWRIGFGLIGGFIAKEVFLDSLAVVAPQAAAGGEAASTLAAYPLTPGQALALMVAVTLYVPCIATIATIYSESGSGRFAASVVAYNFALATIAAIVVRAAAALLGLG